VAVFHDIH
jgi:hypothetical protein